MSGEPPRGLRSSFAPLRHRQFALVWTAALISNAGTWMQTIAVGALVTEVTGQARWTGIVAAAAFVPNGLAGPVGGALADRLDRRRLLMLANAIEAALAAVLAIEYFAGNASPALISLIVLAGGLAGGIGFPCYQSMLPDLVPREDLLGAVALSAAQWNFGRVIGPALAAAVIAVGGYGAAILLNAASFAAPALVMLFLKVDSPRSGQGTTLWSQIAEGFRTVRQDRLLRHSFWLCAAVSLTVSPFIALVPAEAILVLGGDSGTAALLVTAQGIGAVAGALLATPLAARFGRARLMRSWLYLLPAATVVYAAPVSVPGAAAGLLVLGLVYLGVFAGLNVSVQLRAPEAVRGRVLSLYFAVIGLVYPAASLVHGRLADLIGSGGGSGLRAVTAGGGVLFGVALVLMSRRRREWLASLDEQVTEQPSTMPA